MIDRCKVCHRADCAIQLHLYRLSRLHPDFATRAWALGELRARWNGTARRAR